MLTCCTCAAEENKHARACTCAFLVNISTKNTISATTKTFGFHNSSRKTSKVMTSIASFHLCPLCVEPSDIISPALSSLWFYCKRLQVHLHDNMPIQPPQPFGLYFTPCSPRAPTEKAEFNYINVKSSEMVFMHFLWEITVFL